MKHYKIQYPDEHGNDIEEVLSENDILQHYWEYWSNAMKSVGREDLINPENCIKDWVTVNWAWEFEDV